MVRMTTPPTSIGIDAGRFWSTVMRSGEIGPGVDRVGTIFARRPGRDDHLSPVLMGSHLDTQVAGGKYDGIVGVLAGLEVLRTLDDRRVGTKRPLAARQVARPGRPSRPRKPSSAAARSPERAPSRGRSAQARRRPCPASAG